MNFFSENLNRVPPPIPPRASAIVNAKLQHVVIFQNSPTKSVQTEKSGTTTFYDFLEK
jgi:hypothetical protein